MCRNAFLSFCFFSIFSYGAAPCFANFNETRNPSSCVSTILFPVPHSTLRYIKYFLFWLFRYKGCDELYLYELTIVSSITLLRIFLCFNLSFTSKGTSVYYDVDKLSRCSEVLAVLCWIKLNQRNLHAKKSYRQLRSPLILGSSDHTSMNKFQWVQRSVIGGFNIPTDYKKMMASDTFSLKAR